MPKFIPQSARYAVWNLLASLGVSIGEVDLDFAPRQQKILIDWRTTGESCATLTLNVHTGEWVAA